MANTREDPVRAESAWRLHWRLAWNVHLQTQDKAPKLLYSADPCCGAVGRTYCLALDEIKMPLLHAYYKALVDKVLEEIPALREFNEIVFDKMVNDYINLDHKRFDINKSIIREKIQSLKPL